METRNVFEHLYNSKAWGDGVSVPLSGGGSNPDVARPYVQFVEEVIDRYQIRSVVDLGHGDWSMWRDFKFPALDYFGIDVVPYLSERNTKMFGSDRIKFVSGNFLKLEIPNADLMISKEVFQHLSNVRVMEILENLKNFKYLILSNAIHINTLSSIIRFLPARIAVRSRMKALKRKRNPLFMVRRKNNIEIDDGEWRAIDLESDPFKELLLNWKLERKLIYPGSNYNGVNQAVYLYSRSPN